MQDDKKPQSEWKVLHSEYLSRKPWLTVRCDHLKLPNGNEIPNYYVLEYPDWINVLAITKDQKFVFVKHLGKCFRRRRLRNQRCFTVGVCKT